jgi:hypothetical protein
MVRQMEERIELYLKQDFPGDPLPIPFQGPVISDNVPLDHKIR